MATAMTSLVTTTMLGLATTTIMAVAMYAVPRMSYLSHHVAQCVWQTLLSIVDWAKMTTRMPTLMCGAPLQSTERCQTYDLIEE